MILAFEAYRLIKSMFRTWVELYSTVATSREEVLQVKTLLKQDEKKLSGNKDNRVKILS